VFKVIFHISSLSLHAFFITSTCTFCPSQPSGFCDSSTVIFGEGEKV